VTTDNLTNLERQITALRKLADEMRDTMQLAWRRDEPVLPLSMTVREACRARTPLDGTDAQALEHALTLTERERDEAMQGKEALCGCISVIAHYLDMDPTELICNTSRVLESKAAAAPAKPQISTKIIGDLEWRDELVAKMSWDKALEYAKSLGGGWRLPTVQEIVSLWDYDKGCCPAFPDASRRYWSSSPYDSLYAWYVDFDSGHVRNDSRGYEIGVRCVRDVQGLE
jgi:hypothetical protein